MLIFDILLGKLMFPKLGLPKYPPFLFRFRTPKYQNLGILNSISYQFHQNSTLLPKFCHWAFIYRQFETKYFLPMSAAVVAVIIVITHILAVMTRPTKTILSIIALIITLPSSAPSSSPNIFFPLLNAPLSKS